MDGYSKSIAIDCACIVNVAAVGGARPVVVTGVLEHWPALKLWQNMSYLEQLAGHRTVPVEVGRTYLEDGWGTQLMTLSSFLQQHVQGEHPELTVGSVL
jgi:hypothetical protein